MKDLFETPQTKIFRQLLKSICERCGVTEIVALVEFNQQKTGLIQHSTTGRKNKAYNSLFEGLENLLIETNNENAKKN